MNEESLFAAALERATAAERRAFLREACGDDVGLRRRVDRLLAAHEKTLGILDHPPSPTWPEGAGGDPGFVGFARGEQAGTVVAGRYELIREVGEGGMGTVWLAEQTQPVRRKVALKLIKPGMDSRSVLARFEAERQALAQMDHPNIAKVLDGGTTEGGRPFFVMEYVEGVPFTKYCDDARLCIEERLALFVPACQAVQHAHSKGILHRDLKPTNILVGLYDGEPVPKVIDFGLAKALHGPLTDRTLQTAPGVMMGTPLYISPEQAEFNNPDIDTRTDIYALGVILYELLTGTTPLEQRRFHQAAWHEILRLIREEEPPCPSDRLIGSDSLPSLAAERQLEPFRLTRLVRGELDWIVMKCLEKDRSRRYETASGLARDVQRYLTDESVEACPPSAGYRLRKFVRRNRAVVLSASLILLMLIGGVVGTTWGLMCAERARRAEAVRAEGERKANAQATKRLRQVEKGAEILASVFVDLDPRAEEKEGRPLRAILGDRLARAAEQLEGDGVGDPLLVAGLQDRLGMSLLRLGLADRAIPLHLKARATRAAMLGPDHPETLESMNNLARSYQEFGDLGHALPLFEETVALMKAQRGPRHADTLTCLSNLAVGYLDDGHPDRAVPLLEEVLESRKVVRGPDHAETLDSMNNLALGYQAVTRMDLALPLLEKALEMRKAKFGPDHFDTLTSMNGLATGYRAIQDLDRAIPLYEETLRLRQTKNGPDHPTTLTSLANLASAYRAARKQDLALPLLEEAYRLTRAKLEPDHPTTLTCMCNLAGGYRESKKLDQSRQLYEEALRLMKGKLSPGHPDILVCLNNLAGCHRAAGDLDRALPYYLEAATGVQEHRYAVHGSGPIVKNLIRCQEQLKRFDKAEPWWREWLAASKERGVSPEYALDLEGLGRNLLAQEKWAEAEPVFREVLAFREKKEPNAWSTHEARSQLGRALLGRGQYAEAEPLLVRGHEGLKSLEAQIPPPERHRVAESGEQVIRLYEAWGKPGEAARWRDRMAGPKPSGVVPR